MVEAHSSVGELACPDCAAASRRVHSRYRRHLAELPVGGRRVVVRLTVRRFFCDTATCSRRTFVEQVEGLTSKYARAGPGVNVWWRAVALAVGGRPGARLCRVLAAPTGRARLFGQLHAPPVPSRSPRVLGVDDFAFRRSRTYGTIILDVEKSAVIDVLPDRTSETLAAWLRLACPDITRACDLARVFHDLVRHRRGHLLLEWIRQAEQDAPVPIRSFAGFLRHDLDPVTAGLTLTYSSGVIEGHINCCLDDQEADVRPRVVPTPPHPCPVAIVTVTRCRRPDPNSRSLIRGAGTGRNRG
ncbi:transposase family protein [Streptomyces mirabilis]|uniref:transposase family protein n=1 Tax=Streptomyces mirabilis TaxID=68239 RepID=UPI0036EDBDCF